jgi:hypothetical protein
MLWPADEPWPVCTEVHRRSRGRRPADIRREREITAAADAREPYSGLTDEERLLVHELRRKHRIPELSDADPLPMIGLAQFYRRDIPDLPPGPDGCDLLQVFWCPFDAHGASGHESLLQLRWRKSDQVGELLVAPPEPQVVGYDGYVPEPCVLHPEQVVTYPFAGLLPEALSARIDDWEEALEEEWDEEAEEEQAGDAAEPEPEPESESESESEPIGYQYDLSIPPGWRIGGFASWHVTDPCAMDCTACGSPMDLLLTIDSSEWDGGSGSWQPVEEKGLPPYPYATPTKVVVGRTGELNVFACPTDPAHPHRWSLQ